MRSVSALLDEAQACLRQGRRPRARQLCLEALRREPNSAGSWFVLGLLALEERGFEQASEHFGKAALLDPGNALIKARQAESLAACGHTARARELAYAAAALTQDSVTLDAAGSVLATVRDMEGAREVYSRAARGPGAHPETIRNHGLILHMLGDFDGAEDCYRRTLSLDPSAYRAWWGLVRLRRQTEQDNDVPQLQEQLDGASDDRAAIYLAHALAKCLEDLGRYDEAIQALERGKAAIRRQYPYDVAADRALFEAAADLAAGPVVANGPKAGEAPIFVVGMPRSGTTLVERILASHPSMHSHGESMALTAAVLRAIGAPPRPTKVEAETIQRLRRADFDALGREYLTALAVERRRIVDKMPHNVLFTGAIRRAMPNARIVCMRRDPLDTAFGNYAQMFVQNFSHFRHSLDMRASAHRQVHFESLVRRLRVSIPADRFMELDYQHLVRSPEPAIRRLLAFCGLEWNEACLNFHEKGGAVLTASSEQVRRPLNADSIGRAERFGEALDPMREVLEAAGCLGSPARPPRSRVRVA